jgi:hypothetical protein
MFLGSADAGQAADVLLEEEDGVDGVLLDDEPDDDELLPLSEDLLSEPLLLLAAGALPDDEPRLSVR